MAANNSHDFLALEIIFRNLSPMAEQLFPDIKNGFSKVLGDRNWLWKVLLGGFLLINPLLLALAPAFFGGNGPTWVRPVFYSALVFNILSFWFPLGFTYEVLRRAVRGGEQLPDWNLHQLPCFAREGAVKLVISVTTLILPVLLWMAVCHVLFIRFLGLPESILSLFLPPVMLFVIPLCGVACCRWLDGASVWSCALNFPENIRLFRKRWKEYLIASAFLTGINAVTTSFFYTIPFAALFGLCLVDTWFGPIYASSVGKMGGNQPVRQHSKPEAFVSIV